MPEQLPESYLAVLKQAQDFVAQEIVPRGAPPTLRLRVCLDFVGWVRRLLEMFRIVRKAMRRNPP